MTKEEYAKLLITERRLPQKLWPICMYLFHQNRFEVVLWVISTAFFLALVAWGENNIVVGMLLALNLTQLAAAIRSVRSYLEVNRWDREFIDWSRVEEAAGATVQEPGPSL